MLYARETDDTETDYLQIELQAVRGLSLEEAAKAYKQLMRAIKPVFSGDIDPLINQLDYQKIRARLSSQHGRASLNRREVTLTEEFLTKRR